MSKYDTLSERLAAHGGDEWRPSFSELESVLGFSLPKAARSSQAWWANDPGKSHSRAWTVRGWEVGDVDHAGQRVVFRRGAAQAVAAPPTEVQPPAMRAAAESASARMHANRAAGTAALVAGGVAAAAALAAVLVKGLLRRRG